MSRRFRVAATVVASLLLAALPATGAGATSIDFTSPLLGFDTAPHGSFLVADTGAGVHRIGNHKVRTVELPGASDVSAAEPGLWWVTTGAPQGQTGQDSGQGVYRVHNGTPTRVANLFTHEEENNPDGAIVDSNPFGVQALSADEALVVDSGANALHRVDRHGDVTTLATFPGSPVPTANLKSLAGCPDSGAEFCGLPDELPAESVPTSVVVGPDGWYWVSELRGFPAPTDHSRVWRVSPEASGAECGTTPECELAIDGGFTSIVDLKFGPDGALYVVELDERSWAAVEIFQQPTGGTVNRCDLGTLSCGNVHTGLPVVTAVTFDLDGRLWALTNALDPEAADVTKLG